LTLPLGANFDPRGEVASQEWTLSPGWGWSYPLEVKFYVRPSIPINNRVCSPLGPEVNKGANIPFWGQSSPMWAKFTHRDKLHPWGQNMLLKTGLWVHTYPSLCSHVCTYMKTQKFTLRCLKPWNFSKKARFWRPHFENPILRSIRAGWPDWANFRNWVIVSFDQIFKNCIRGPDSWSAYFRGK
jgi:hypothetical protein